MARHEASCTRERAFRAIVVLLSAGCSLVRVVSAQESTFEEYRVKAAFLYNAMKFVQWPAAITADVSSPFLLCLVGEDPFGSSLDGAMEGRTVQGHSILVKRAESSSDVADASKCTVLFLANSENGRAADLLGRLEGAPVLSVAEWEGFSSAGGILELRIVDDKLAFVVNQRAAEARQLKISSQFLKLAKKVLR